MMKKILFVTCLLLSNIGNARGIPLPYCADCQYFEIVEELPDTEEYYSEEYAGYADLAFVYNQLWALWLPIWNTDGRYCLYIKDKDIYFDLTKSELDELSKMNGFSLSSNPIPFWDKIGGKLILISLLFLIVWGWLKPKKSKV